MWLKSKQVICVEFSPDKIVPILVGPGGAIATLLLFISYLMKETSAARKERDSYQAKYEEMREQRDEFRFIAGDAVRAGKRSAATQVAIAHGRHQEDPKS